MNVVVLISSLNPEKQLADFVKQLADAGIPKILVINDGSDKESDNVFRKCGKVEQCVIIPHDENMGKGFALKTGMQYYRDNLTGYDGIVTCDCDGQHAVEDVIKVASMMHEVSDSLVLGVRDFSVPNVPKRSKFGNIITKYLMKMLFKTKLSDTQTGLRGIPDAIVDKFLEVKGSRFEYETNMLIESIKSNVEIIETPIQTIYYDNNKNSNYRVVSDSLRVYWPLIGKMVKFFMSAFCFYCAELIIYIILTMIAFRNFDSGSVILASQACAKACSCAGNFFVNKHSVFNKSGNNIECLIKYILVLMLLVVASSTIISMLMSLLKVESSSSTLIKIFVDFFMMLINFYLQRRWVFND